MTHDFDVWEGDPLNDTYGNEAVLLTGCNSLREAS